jgi:hypothetical protein
MTAQILCVFCIIYYTPFSASVGPWKENFFVRFANDGNWRALRSIQRVRWARGVGAQRFFFCVSISPKDKCAQRTGAHTRGQNPLVFYNPIKIN